MTPFETSYQPLNKHLSLAGDRQRIPACPLKSDILLFSSSEDCYPILSKADHFSSRNYASLILESILERSPWFEDFMKSDLYHLAKAYVSVIEEIEETTDPANLRRLEEKRVELHWKFIQLLKRQGIKFRDRDHATQIALRVAKGEL